MSQKTRLSVSKTQLFPLYGQIDVEEESDVKIIVYNIKGDRVAGLSYNGQFDKGSHILLIYRSYRRGLHI